MSDPTIKAIETRYKGSRFGSRLGAAWAGFFDALWLTWEYEPEGFVLPDGTHYLPDFRVTSPQGLVTWYEVKAPGHGAGSKMPQLEKAMTPPLQAITPNASLFLDQFMTLVGDPVDVLQDHEVCPRCGTISTEQWEDLSRGVPIYGFNCWPCDIDTPSGDGNEEELGAIVPTIPRKGWLTAGVKEVQTHYAKRISAAKRARSARFEHEEQP